MSISTTMPATLDTPGHRLREFVHSITRRVALWIHWSACICMVAALAIQWKFADENAYLGMLFYATPPQVLAGFAIGTAVLCWFGGRRFCSALWSIGAMTCIIWSFGTTVYAHDRAVPVQPEPKSIRVAFWNVGRGLGGWNNIVQEIQTWNADVIGIVESGVSVGSEREFWQDNFPGYDVSMLGGEFVLLVRGTSGECTPGTLANLGRYRAIDATVHDSEFSLIMVDIVSTPHLFRGPTLEKLTDFLKTKTDKPTLLIGDFNTPTNSVHFQKMRSDWTNAFEDVGNGYAPTWPVPAPVLALDHIWYNQHISPIACQHEWSLASDHRPVIFDMQR